MPRNKGWFRLYDRMIDSPQVLELNDSEFRLLVSLWCLCSAEGGDGTISYTAAAIRRRTMPDHSIDEINAMLEHLKQLDLLAGEDGKYQIPRWEEHQYEYTSRIPRNRSDLKTADSAKETKEKTAENNRKENGKSTESKRKENGKIDTEAEADTDPETDTETDLLEVAERGGVRGGEIPAAAPDDKPELTKTEREALAELKSIPGYPFDFDKDLKLLRNLETDFPDVDVLPELKKYHIYKLDHPLKKNSNPRLQLRNWFENAQRWRKEDRNGSNGRTFTNQGTNSKHPGTDKSEFDKIDFSKFEYKSGVSKVPGPRGDPAGQRDSPDLHLPTAEET